MSVPMVSRWSGTLINGVGRHPSRAGRWLIAPVPAAWEGLEGAEGITREPEMEMGWELGKEFDERGSRDQVTFKTLNSSLATLWNYPIGTQDEAQSSQELVKATGSLSSSHRSNVTPGGPGQKFSTWICIKLCECQRQQTANEEGLAQHATEQCVYICVHV